MTIEFTTEVYGSPNITTEIIAGGAPGLSAYQIAVAKGYSGTDDEWLASLQGEDAEIDPAVLAAAIEDYLTENPQGGAVDSVAGKTGVVVLTQDDIADGTTAKQYTATEKTKLAEIAEAATANSTDADLRDRATHTGTQSADTIVDGSTNHVFTAADDTKLAGIASGATANSPDATLLARANHTGTQSADTLTDGTTNKAFLATERTKLAGIATGATANSSDATLEARANHTGTQLAATISDFSTAADARVAAGRFARATQTFTSSSLATGAYQTSTVTLAASFDIFFVQVDRACRVRLYDSTTHRDSDAARSTGTLPTTTGVNHGCFLELIFTAAGTQTVTGGPVGYLASGSAVPITVTNSSGSTSTVAVTFTYLPKE